MFRSSRPLMEFSKEVKCFLAWRYPNNYECTIEKENSIIYVEIAEEYRVAIFYGDDPKKKSEIDETICDYVLEVKNKNIKTVKNYFNKNIYIAPYPNSFNKAQILHFDEYQKEAICSDFYTPLKIIAGAGAGKTTTICARILYLIIECYLSPENLILITFTKTAANDMRDRLFNMVEKNGVGNRFSVNRMKIATIDSMIKSYIEKSGNNLLFPDMEENNPYFINYLKSCDEKGKVPQFLRNIEHVFIDETQDLSHDQADIIHYISKISASAKITAVGDPKQAIYAFRNGTPEYLKDRFYYLCGKVGISETEANENFFATIVRLKYNYRSQKPIVEFANHIIKFIENYSTDNMISKAKPNNFRKRRPQYIFAVRSRESNLHLEHQFENIVDHINELCENSTTKYHNIAILTISNWNVKKITNYLHNQNIPVYCKNKTDDNMSTNESLPKNRVHVLTVHTTKGLEWDHVICVDFNDKELPRYGKDYTNIEFQQSLNLLFVAATRAKNTLLFTFTIEQENELDCEENPYEKNKPKKQEKYPSRLLCPSLTDEENPKIVSKYPTDPNRNIFTIYSREKLNSLDEHHKKQEKPNKKPFHQDMHYISDICQSISGDVFLNKLRPIINFGGKTPYKKRSIHKETLFENKNNKPGTDTRITFSNHPDIVLENGFQQDIGQLIDYHIEVSLNYRNGSPEKISYCNYIEKSLVNKNNKHYDDHIYKIFPHMKQNYEKFFNYIIENEEKDPEFLNNLLKRCIKVSNYIRNNSRSKKRDEENELNETLFEFVEKLYGKDRTSLSATDIKEGRYGKLIIMNEEERKNLFKNYKKNKISIKTLYLDYMIETIHSIIELKKQLEFENIKFHKNLFANENSLLKFLNAIRNIKENKHNIDGDDLLKSDFSNCVPIHEYIQAKNYILSQNEIKYVRKDEHVSKKYVNAIFLMSRISKFTGNNHYELDVNDYVRIKIDDIYHHYKDLIKTIQKEYIETYLQNNDHEEGVTLTPKFILIGSKCIDGTLYTYKGEADIYASYPKKIIEVKCSSHDFTIRHFIQAFMYLHMLNNSKINFKNEEEKIKKIELYNPLKGIVVEFDVSYLVETEKGDELIEQILRNARTKNKN